MVWFVNVWLHIEVKTSMLTSDWSVMRWPTIYTGRWQIMMRNIKCFKAHGSPGKRSLHSIRCYFCCSWCDSRHRAGNKRAAWVSWCRWSLGRGLYLFENDSFSDRVSGSCYGCYYLDYNYFQNLESKKVLTSMVSVSRTDSVNLEPTLEWRGGWRTAEVSMMDDFYDAELMIWWFGSKINIVDALPWGIIIDFESLFICNSFDHVLRKSA